MRPTSAGEDPPGRAAWRRLLGFPRALIIAAALATILALPSVLGAPDARPWEQMRDRQPCLSYSHDRTRGMTSRPTVTRESLRLPITAFAS